MAESKVVYRDDGEINIIRGQVDDTSDPDFVIVTRRDGVVKIARRNVERIDGLGGK